MTKPLRFHFGDFVLDLGNRSLLCQGAAVPLSARYFDALALLVRESGQLIGKQRFFDEVWAGSVVTDAALTQCIKEIRRVLADDASDPRYVRTVPGHGYCFIASVMALEESKQQGVASARMATRSDPPAVAPVTPSSRHDAWRCGLTWVLAATSGGAAAGLFGGLLYGSVLAFSPQGQSMGSLSVLLVLLALSMLVGLLGAFGVGLGLSTGLLLGRAGMALAGATLGGLVMGGLVKLLGSDTLTLLMGQTPSGITGGLEGAAVGFAVAAGLLLGGGISAHSPGRSALFASLTTGLAGALIALAGGSLMATSLARVSAAFDGARLDLTPLARWFGESQLGPLAQTALGALEGAVFGGCVVGALLLAQRHSLQQHDVSAHRSGPRA